MHEEQDGTGTRMFDEHCYIIFLGGFFIFSIFTLYLVIQIP